MRIAHFNQVRERGTARTATSVISPEAPHTIAAGRNTVESQKTYWEKRAETRWGSYISAIEQDAILAAHASFDRVGNCLDVGCEGGRWSRLLADLGWSVTGIDINPVTLSSCRQRHRSVRCILVGEADQQFPIDTASVELLLCIECPVANSTWFASEARRVLKPGGRLVATCLNRASWRGFPRNLKSTVLRAQRYYVKSFSSQCKSLRADGFQIDSGRGFCWAPFGRESNSRFIGVAASLERWMKLDKFTAVSPWVIYTATRLPDTTNAETTG